MPKKKKTAAKKVEKVEVDEIFEKKVVEEPPIRKQKNSKILVYGLVLVAAIIVVGGGLYFYNKNSGDQTSQVTRQTQELVNRVGHLLVLPKNETPTIATVTDKTKLAGQPFFADAENGDKVLLYGQSQRAVLFRPSTNQIVNVSPLNLKEQANAVASPNTTNPQTNAISPTPSVAPAQVKVQILNGTKVNGLTKTAESKIKAGGVDIVAIDRGNATGNFDKSVVVDVTGKNAEVASKIASIIGAKVGGIPSGETASKDAEILIVLGLDFTAAK
ncbi:MAG TPA: LytR C-terminal domain-containing protein [Patescibacteria group bacterium]|nr:LytR C-terminal domain-containing protein [Patescibacteria group bacterium]